MELVDKYDKRRASLNKITDRWNEVSGEYRISIHLWIMNDKGQFLIQKRSESKKKYPGVWSITGGGVNAGEQSYETVIREAKEELGIDINPNNVEYMLSLRRKFNFSDIYLLKSNIDMNSIVMQEEEVDDVKWASVAEIKAMIDNGEFSRNIGLYLDLLINLIEGK